MASLPTAPWSLVDFLARIPNRLSTRQKWSRQSGRGVARALLNQHAGRYLIYIMTWGLWKLIDKLAMRVNVTQNVATP